MKMADKSQDWILENISKKYKLFKNYELHEKHDYLFCLTLQF